MSQSSTAVLAHHTGPEFEPSLVGGLPVSWREVVAGVALVALAALVLRRHVTQVRAGDGTAPATPSPAGSTLRDQALGALAVAIGLLVVTPLVWRTAYRLVDSAMTAERIATLAVAAVALLAVGLAQRRQVLVTGLLATLLYAIVHALAAPYGAQASVPATAVATGALLIVCLPPPSRLAQAARAIGVVLCWPLVAFAGAQGWGGDVARARAAVLLAVAACLVPAVLGSRGGRPAGTQTRPPAGQHP